MTEKPHQNLQFNSAISGGRINNIGCMKKLFAALTIVGLHTAACAGSAPLDFSYRVTGQGEMKPLLVFNDGVDTFIQPQDGLTGAVVNGAQPTRQGPYYVVRGLAQVVTISVPKKGEVTIAYAGKLQAPVAAPKVAPKAEAPLVVTKSADLPTASKRADVAADPAKHSDVTTDLAKQKATDSQQPVEPAKSSLTCRATEKRASAFVVTFKASTSSMSDETVKGLKKLVGNGSEVSSVEVIAEANSKALSQKRGEAIKSALSASGVSAGVVTISSRDPSVIGSEVHLERDVQVPCAGAQVVTIPSKTSPVTIVWNGDGKTLAERVAKELGVSFEVQGDKTVSLPVALTVKKLPFGDAMELFGDELGDRADFVLSRGKAVLIIKGDSTQ